MQDITELLEKKKDYYLLGYNQPFCFDHVFRNIEGLKLFFMSKSGDGVGLTKYGQYENGGPVVIQESPWSVSESNPLHKPKFQPEHDEVIKVWNKGLSEGVKKAHFARMSQDGSYACYVNGMSSETVYDPQNHVAVWDYAKPLES